VTFDKTHPYVPNGFGRQSTYRVADLSNPILQPWTIPSMKKANEEVLAGKVPFRARERCWPVGVPGFVAYSLVEPFFFYQTRDKVVVVNQGGPEIRRIYLNIAHSKNVKPTWYGESVGHYEAGDTLVIDTIGISPKSFIDNYRTPHTDQLHVVERWQLAADGKAVDISVFVEDPGVVGRAALAPGRRRTALDDNVQREQRRFLRPGAGAAARGRRAGFLIAFSPRLHHDLNSSRHARASV
jgi:hypothetical protein